MKPNLKKSFFFFFIIFILGIVYIQKMDSIEDEQMGLNENLSVDYPASDIDSNVSECYSGTESIFKFEYCQDVE